MSTTRVLATALPHSLLPEAQFHLSVFFTHRLTPEADGSTVADFPETAAWVDTLLAGTLELVTDTAPEGVAVRLVSTPDATDWAAVFPKRTPVAGFETPKVTDQPWKTYPAHTIDGHALDLHLGSAMASPFHRPPALGNPVTDRVLHELMSIQPNVETLLGMQGHRADREKRIRARKLQEARATLGLQRARHPSEPMRSPAGAIEHLLDDRGESEQVATRNLDALLDSQEPATGALATLRDVHAARRFYQREEIEYQETPDRDEQARMDPPEHDFHQRAAGLGGTPVLLRTLGLVVDVAVDEADDRDRLAAATWVSARFTPADGADVVRLAPPRTWCEAADGHWRAASTGAWSGGAVPLGDPDAYTVLDLDPDASALKLEQHLRDLPRAAASELNGDPASSAPGTLRSTGFSIAKVGRDQAVLSQVQRAEGFAPVDDDGQVAGLDLVYDDVVRGLRLEVWDDDSGAWHSVHERRVDVTVKGTPVLTDAEDTGFLQLTGLTRAPAASSPYHLHEVFVGWDGWSLSAPRPGKVIVHGEPKPTDEREEHPGNDVHVVTRVEPGTLPWLRYGRAYSFRIRGVDLAGNSVPRPPAPAAPDDASVTAAGAQIDRLRGAFDARDRAGILGDVRDLVLERLGEAAGDLGRALIDSVAEAGDDLAAFQERLAEEAFLPGEVQLPEGAATGVDQVDDALRARVAEAIAKRPRAAIERAAVAAALSRVAGERETWRVRTNLELDARAFAGLDDTIDPIKVRPELPDLGHEPVEPPPPQVPVVTTPRPFLRWNPVPPPTLVARLPLGTGESLQRLVYRDGQQSERHVVPPKTTQLEAEQHGMFDTAIGSTDPAVQRRALAVALKERGTLLDTHIQDLADPNGETEQPGIALHTRPGADPATLTTLAAIRAQRDTPLGEGQYVVHDTDQLVLPYLPDPMATGISLVFYDAGAPHTLPEPKVLQTVVLPYKQKKWPETEPIRLVVAAGAELGAHRRGNVVTVTVPAGEQVRVAISSALDEGDLDVLGLWRSHVASVAGDAERSLLARAAANGWFWWLTPSHDMRLVHAVARPVRPPELAALAVAVRTSGLTVAGLAGVVDVHGPSTERLVLEATWEEWVDDIAADGPVQVERHDVVLSSPVRPYERFGVLSLVDDLLGGDDGTEPVVSHQAIQTFPDTHHRRVSYAARGLSRYAEYFLPSERPADDDPTLLGELRELTVVSAARPAVPEVLDVVPLLLWDEHTEPDQPFALQRVRRSGARIWLDRPWFSSGDGELLAVVLGGEAPPTQASRWGKDPVLATGVPADAAAPPLVRPHDLVTTTIAGEVVDPRPGRPVTPFVDTRLVDLHEQPSVQVLGYQPEYHPGRKQWYVDVAIDPGDSLWPFVRLAVARYQPHSLPDHELSPVVLTDWVQPLPERVATANRRTDDTVRLTVTGPIGLTREPERRRGEGEVSGLDGLVRPSREVFATVQQAPEAGKGDLDWRDHERLRLPLVGLEAGRGTWSEELSLPRAISLRTPGSGAVRWRVLVEEYEYFHADPTAGEKEGRPERAERLVYADHFPL